jgi:hypothetical protein
VIDMLSRYDFLLTSVVVCSGDDALARAVTLTVGGIPQGGGPMVFAPSIKQYAQAITQHAKRVRVALSESFPDVTGPPVCTMEGRKCDVPTALGRSFDVLVVAEGLGLGCWSGIVDPRVRFQKALVRDSRVPVLFVRPTASLEYIALADRDNAVSPQAKERFAPIAKRMGIEVLAWPIGPARVSSLGSLGCDDPETQTARFHPICDAGCRLPSEQAQKKTCLVVRARALLARFRFAGTRRMLRQWPGHVLIWPKSRRQAKEDDTRAEGNGAP